MSNAVTLWRIYCITENRFTYGYSGSALTTCPNNVAHTVQAGSSTISTHYNSGNLFSIGDLINYTVTETTRSLSADAYYQNLIIPIGVTLNSNGYRIFVAGTLTLTGNINNNGGNASGITAGVRAAPGTIGGGSAGGNGSNASGTPGTAGTALGAGIRIGGGGGPGGNGTSAGGTGGTGTVPADNVGGVINIRNSIGALLTRDLSGVALYGGTGAGGGGGTTATGTGGGGGGGGGVVFIAANKFNLNGGTISANGGNGANGSGAGSAGGGGAGAGGVVILITSTTLSSSTFITVSAGSVGTGVNGGTSGGVGGNGYSAIYYV